MSLPGDLFYGGQVLDDSLERLAKAGSLEAIRGEVNRFVRNGVILQVRAAVRDWAAAGLCGAAVRDWAAVGVRGCGGVKLRGRGPAGAVGLAQVSRRSGGMWHPRDL